jgi:hypothetical protein
LAVQSSPELGRLFGLAAITFRSTQKAAPRASPVFGKKVPIFGKPFPTQNAPRTVQAAPPIPDGSRLDYHATFQHTTRLSSQSNQEFQMVNTPRIKEHTDVISSDRKTVRKVDHLDGTDKTKLTKQSSPDGQHHHLIPLSWVDHVDHHVYLNKTGADVTSHRQHEGRG